MSSLVLDEDAKSDDKVTACVGAWVHQKVSDHGVPNGVEAWLMYIPKRCMFRGHGVWKVGVLEFSKFG